MKPLPRKSLVLYALPEYACFLGIIPISLYLPFVYAKDFGLDLADVGLILMLARLSDVVTDPLIGHLSWIVQGDLLRALCAKMGEATIAPAADSTAEDERHQW